MFANCLLLPDISMTSEEWPTCLQTTASKGCTSFPPSLLSVRPPWNTVGVSGHSFHCVRTGLRSEETVNGHLEVGENICLWRHGGLVIPQWDLASHVSLLSLLMDFSIVLSVLFFLTKSKSCRYLSICWWENHPSSDHIRQMICLIRLFFFLPFLYSMFFLSRYSKTAKHQDCLHLSVRTSSSVTSCSGCDGLWLNSKPGVHDVRECSVSPVSPQDKLDWTAHFQNALLSRPDCCLASVKPSTLYKLCSATCIRFYSVCFFYYMLCLFFHSQLWGHKGKK